MKVDVRLSGALAREVGRPRLQLTLPDGATAADLVAHLRAHYPQAGAPLDAAVPLIAGRHVSPETPLEAGKEVALLLPIAGGTPPIPHRCLPDIP